MLQISSLLPFFFCIVNTTHLSLGQTSLWRELGSKFIRSDSLERCDRHSGAGNCVLSVLVVNLAEKKSEVDEVCDFLNWSITSGLSVFCIIDIWFCNADNSNKRGWMSFRGWVFKWQFTDQSSTFKSATECLITDLWQQDQWNDSYWRYCKN